MNRPFEIKFDLALANSDIKVSLKATAELHHSEPYYLVTNFYLENSMRPSDYPSILPPQEIRLVNNGRGHVWVHRDSDRESLLSLKMGEAIEKVLTGQKG